MTSYPEILRTLLKRIGLYHPLHDWRRDRRFHRQSTVAIAQWEAAGRPVPPPDLIKYRVIRRYAQERGIRNLVETGTWFGNAIFTLRRDFTEIHSIELAPALHAQASAGFAHLPHIRLHLGDSATELPRVAASLTGPTLYWLDGHFCSGPSARGAKDTPIFEELDYLLRRPPGQDVVLIDDARCFNGADGYPTIEQLRQMVTPLRPHASFTVETDIIRIVPV